MKQDLEELRKEKNEKLDNLNKIKQEYEYKIRSLESENHEIKQNFEKKLIDYHSQSNDELLEKINFLESKILLEEQNKDDLQKQWLNSYQILEEKLKEIEIFKEEFVKVTEQNSIYLKCLEIYRGR